MRVAVAANGAAVTLLTTRDFVGVAVTCITLEVTDGCRGAGVLMAVEAGVTAAPSASVDSASWPNRSRPTCQYASSALLLVVRKKSAPGKS